MNYYYEALNDISFQKFAQSLIVSVHPDTICLPVRQPDGGRDALYYTAALEQREFVVFQIKFSTKPKDTTEREAIDRLIRSEEKKVASLIEKGATHYYLVTNVQGTAHPETGTIDRLNDTLTKRFKIPCYVWWRDDLDARLDNASDIKWSYPEICRATDVLQLLIRRPEYQAELEAARAITAYMGKQHGDDRDVKFKQVELKRKITDLFVDIPIGHKGSLREGRRDRRAYSSDVVLNRYFEELKEDLDLGSDEDSPFVHRGLAAGFLLHMPFNNGVSRLVLEGAPGQGKSTVTQFLCQVNRLKLLQGRRAELSTVSRVHSEAPTRTPFRTDLRDYAAWVAGRHPFAKAGEATAPDEDQRSLECFLAMQIGWHSGGLSLSQHDLLDFFARAHCVVVLDGFDEVADIPTRARLVDEICDAANRLDSHALSLQIIVTSRPAAFANSPGFPEEDWIHLELNDLKRSNIRDYKQKWSEAQDLTAEEDEALTITLEDKLGQPHLRDLSRNPMQLAILLQLMHVQGAALPDKRTALYDEYMKIFLNREVEKKQIAGDHRELILAIHGLLAWVLQVQAETGKGSGSISKDALTMEVSAYLKKEEHDPALAEAILKGTTERVGALVSRVQGTWEFEVQPLREYFAARHLHKTAPYSPPGSIKRGTRPDRFAALAKSSYWTNVTRFFCGFYDVGELPSLVDGLIAVSERKGYELICQPRRLALMLLGDYVFTQSPRSVRRLIELITKDRSFERLLAANCDDEQRGLTLPELAGGRALFEVCTEMLKLSENDVLRRALRQVIARNGDIESIRELALLGNLLTERPLRKLEEARDLNLIDEMSGEEIERLSDGNVELRVRWLAEANRYDAIMEDPDLYRCAQTGLFNCEMFFFFHGRYRESSSSPLVTLSELLFPHFLSECFAIQPERTGLFGRREFQRRSLLNQGQNAGETRSLDQVEEFCRYVVTLMESEPGVWRSDLTPWEKLVDRGFKEAPEGRLFKMIALLSTFVSSTWQALEDDREENKGVDFASCMAADSINGIWDAHEFSGTPGLVRRLYFAKHKGNSLDWWKDKLSCGTTDHNTVLLATVVCWGSDNVIGELSGQISSALDSLNEEAWSEFWSLITPALSISGPEVMQLESDWFLGNNGLTERLAAALTSRLSEGADRRLVARRCFGRYKGGDWRILQVAADWELHSDPYDEIDWEFAKRLSSQARAKGIENLFSHTHARHRVNVPREVAEEVLSNCEMHNWQFLSLCETSLGSIVAQRERGVAFVSEEEEWFDDEVGV